MIWRYLITIPIMVLLAVELVLFVRIIRKYRKRYVPLLTLLAIFALNFGLCYALTFLPPVPVVEKTAPAAPKTP